jgi:hypothetical protein
LDKQSTRDGSAVVGFDRGIAAVNCLVLACYIMNHGISNLNGFCRMTLRNPGSDWSLDFFASLKATTNYNK